MAESGVVNDAGCNTPAGETPAALSSILCTAELNRRPSRPPNYEIENRSLVALGQALADAPGSILQTLADTILEVLRSGSSGISLLTKDERRFYWPAIAGVWKPHIGGGTPRDFGPCGDVLDQNIPLMFSHVERRYTYFQPVQPVVEECLLAPFYVAGKAVGTVWAVAHDPSRKFDAEDMRLLVSMARFASSAFQVTEMLGQFQESQKKADAANRNKDLFLAALSHELRTPLSPVVLAVNALQHDQSLPAEAQRYLSMIRRNVEVEVRLIDDLLDVSRAVSGKLRLDVEPASVHALLKFVRETCESDLTQKKISLKLNLDAKNDSVSADSARMQQVFWNLLKNAIKFSGEGQTIEVSTSNPTPTTVAVRMKDHGVGISPDVLPRIFAAFEQGAENTTQKFGGLGLGLAIARAVVELHGGIVQAESAGTGHGALFVVQLPLVETDAALTCPPTTAEPPLSTDAVRVLIVEDHADTADVLAKLLKLSGYQVATAGTAKSALEAIAAEPFDVVVSDVGLPDATGYELMREIRDRSKIKGIAMTGYGMEEDFARSREAGFVAHVVKPINMEQLERVIRGVTGLHATAK